MQRSGGSQFHGSLNNRFQDPILKTKPARCQWLMPAVLAAQEAEIRRIMIQSQPGKIVHETLFQKTLHKNRVGGVAQGECPEFMLQY
jgi:hypothetical protein